MDKEQRIKELEKNIEWLKSKIYAPNGMKNCFTLVRLQEWKENKEEIEKLRGLNND